MSSSAKTNLLGLNKKSLEDFFLQIGEKPFRAHQVMKWIHHHGVDDFQQMSNISKKLRAQLEEIAEIKAPQVGVKNFSQDGTRKWVLDIRGSGQIETVFIPDGKRGTLCISSQAGCALDCDFCSTGKQGFQRDLTVDEIVGQVWLAQKSFGPRQNLGEHPITNVVMMGMGEPLLNFDNVVTAMEIIKDDFGYGVSKRRLTLSTSGIAPAIDRLADTIDVSLAVSLHAPNDELRNKLVPVNKKYPLQQLMASCKHFLNKFESNRRRITMEYVMLKGVNDSLAEAKELADLLKDVPSKINLIPFNPFPHTEYQRSSNNAIHRFKDYLQQQGYTATIRTTRGDDIDAACGQLVGNVLDKTRRSAAWQKKIQIRNDNEIN